MIKADRAAMIITLSAGITAFLLFMLLVFLLVRNKQLLKAKPKPEDEDNDGDKPVLPRYLRDVNKHQLDEESDLGASLVKKTVRTENALTTRSLLM